MNLATLLATLLAATSATVTIDGPWLAVLAAGMALSVAVNAYLAIHVRRVEHRLARMSGEVDALRDMLDLRRHHERARPADEAPTEPDHGDAP
ncbi:MAG: hypothetical protein IT382_01815 [Deltaproteobacteria bacterium]|nr:hypothetical protein [Deltaproteobacteria bacterium]